MAADREWGCRGDSLSHVSKAAEAKGTFALYSVLHMGKPRRKRNAGMDTRAEPLRVLQLIAVLRWRDMVIGPECFAEIVVFAAFCPNTRSGSMRCNAFSMAEFKAFSSMGLKYWKFM